MYIVHKVHAQWLNGNREEAVRELAKLDAEKVREFMSYLSHDDKATALIIALDLVEN